MASVSTYRQVLIELVERYSLGRVIPVASNTSTTFTLTTAGLPELRGPFSAAAIPVGSPVVCTVETTGTDALGDRTYVSNWVPSTGVLTVSPAIDSQTDITEIIVFNKDLADPDRALEAVNRAMTNRLGRWEPRPLTYVPDGDLQGTTVADYWTAAANGTFAYANAQTYPAGSAADAVGQTRLNRVLQLTSSGGSTSGDGNGIRVVEGNTLRSWRFLTAMRLVSGSGTATLSWRNNSDSGNEISVEVERGSESQTLALTTLGDFTILAGTFQLPDNCAEIAPRIALSATGLIAQMTPLIAFPMGVMHFPLPSRVESDDVVGNFRYGTPRYGPGGLADVALSEPITSGGCTHWFYDYGDHRTVGFNFPIHRPVWFEEYVNGSAFSAMTDTTTFQLDRVVKWAYAELMDNLMRREMMKAQRSDNGTVLPSVYRPLRNAAFKSAQWQGSEPELKQVVGRR